MVIKKLRMNAIKQAFNIDLKLPKQLFKEEFNKYYYNNELLPDNHYIFFSVLYDFMIKTGEYIIYFYSKRWLDQKYYSFEFNINQHTHESIFETLMFKHENSLLEFFTFSEIVFITTENNSLNIVFDRDTEWLIFQPAEQNETVFKSLYLNNEVFENFRHKTHRTMYEGNVAFRHAFHKNPLYIKELKQNYRIDY